MLAAVLAARRAVNPARGRGDALFACAEPKVVHGRVEEDEDDARLSRAVAEATHAVHGARARGVAMMLRDTHSRSRCRSIGVPRLGW